MYVEVSIAICGLVLAALYYVVRRNKRERIDLRGKHVVVTGGSSGIGYELCLEAFRQGAHVSVVARNPTRLNEIRATLVALAKQNSADNAGSPLQIVQCESLDVGADYDAVVKAFERVGLSS